MDDFHRRFSAAMQELHSVGIKRSGIGRLWDRALQRAGLRLRPPHYQPFWQTTAIAAGAWLVVWGGGMYMFAWKDDVIFIEQPLRATLFAFVLSLISGCLFGFGMALAFRRDRRRHNLTAWEDL